MRDPSDWLSTKIEKELCRLLETKHLYQSLTLDRDSLIGQVLAKAIEKQKHFDPDQLKAKADKALCTDWYPLDEISDQHFRQSATADVEYLPRIAFLIRSIKAPCATCKEAMPMNMVRSLDLAEDRDNRWGRIENPEPGHQDFVFVFECQSCRTQPDAFLVRRRGLKLTLCGRSPMEYTPVPSVIPKEVRSYYSDAVVAAHSGKTLAGLFYLRVLIEQYVRDLAQASEDLYVDELLQAYMARLPEAFRHWSPSLSEWYGKLSDAIHSANESESLFSESLERITTHFEGVRAYEKSSGWKLLKSDSPS